MILTSPHPSAPVLFCLAHAGGSAQSFRPWRDDGLALGLDVAPVELPGHGRRLLEPPHDCVASLVATLAPLLATYRGGRAFALFGHSMGAVLAYALARAEPPAALFVSAACAPGQPVLAGVDTADDDAQRALLRRLSATPQDILDGELMELILPTFRADLRLMEDVATLGLQALECPIRTYGGTQDPLVSAADLAAWRALTHGLFSSRTFAGGHFFTATCGAAILEDVAAQLG